MISVGNSDGRKGLGFGVGREMEEIEFEEGEAYQNDDDSTIDPDVALSYLDEKLQDVLGHFQKDFEGGVSAENLGAKFGGYGSFLPTYQRSPVGSQNYKAPRSPNNLHPEGGHHKSVVPSSASLSVRPEPASASAASLPSLRAPSLDDLVKRDICLSSTRAEESMSKGEFVEVSGNPSDQKTLKVRIKVGSDNLSTRKNAEIYSGLGLDVSPSSSFDDSPTDSEGLNHEPLDAPYLSPTSILQIMTSFPVFGDLLLSPLADHLIILIEEENLRGGRRFGLGKKGTQESPMTLVNGADSAQGDGKVLGDKKLKPSEKHAFSVELKSGYGKNARSGIGLVKKEMEIDTFACEELVSNALKLPLLADYDVLDSANDTDTAKEVVISKVVDQDVSGIVKEEHLENDRWGVKPNGKVLEEKKASSHDDLAKKDEDIKEEKSDVFAKGGSNVTKGRKAPNTEPMDPLKQKAGQKVTSQKEHDTKLDTSKEHSSSECKKKSKGSQSHGAQSTEIPKDSLRIDSSLAHKNKKSTLATNLLSESELEDFKLQKDNGKATDRYRDFFGDIELDHGDNDLDLAEMPSITFASNITSNERSNTKKIDRPSRADGYPKAAPNVAPINGSGPTSDPAPGTVAPVVQEDWVCCDKCQKWRLLPLGTNPDNLPEKWLCSMLYWLPGMNRCSISEEETTKALTAHYQVPPPESQDNQHGHPGEAISGVTSSDGPHFNQNNPNIGFRAVANERKKHGLKEMSNTTDQDGPSDFPNCMKKSLQSSAKSRSLNGVNQSPSEKHRHKQKDKNKLLEHHSDGGTTKYSKMKNKRETDQESFGEFKKIKIDDGNDRRNYNDHSSNRDLKSDAKNCSQVPDINPEDQVQVVSDDGSRHVGKCDDNVIVASKRKESELQGSQNCSGFHPSEGNQLLDSRDFVEEMNENDHRTEKKAKVQPSVAATSSSSKVSGSCKNKTNLHEVKGSPVESVSSSPMRVLNPNKATPTVRKDETFTVAHRGSVGPTVLDFQDKDMNHLSGSNAKTQTIHSPKFANPHFIGGPTDTLGLGNQYPCKPQTLNKGRDEERKIENQYRNIASRSRKSGKGSSSRSKDKGKKISDSVNESVDHRLYEEKLRVGKNKLDEKSRVNSDKVENNFMGKKDSAGKSIEMGKRESQSKSGNHNAGSNHDQRQKLLNRDGERPSKRLHSSKPDREDSGRGKSNTLPPSGRVQNESGPRCTQSIPGSQKDNGANGLSGNASGGDEVLKVRKQIKKSENQNGNQSTPGGHKVRDVDAPSPIRRDSSSQAATNAIKEAKNLKHLADRLKNSGSNLESISIYFQAALKFLHGASLLESGNSESAKHGETVQSLQIYSSTAKLCEFCAHEYEKSKGMAAAALAYKCAEVAYMRVIYCSHSSASRDRNELQRALQIVPPGESPSSSASDVDNLNNGVTIDKGVFAKAVSSPQVAGNHVIAAQSRNSFNRLLNFANEVNLAMEASRKSRIAFTAANLRLEEAQHREGITSVKMALDYNFQDVEGLLRLVRLAMEAVTH